MTYRLHYGTKPLTDWVDKAAKDVEAWVTTVAAEHDLDPKVITIGIDGGTTTAPKGGTKAAPKAKK